MPTIEREVALEALSALLDTPVVPEEFYTPEGSSSSEEFYTPVESSTSEEFYTPEESSTSEEPRTHVVPFTAKLNITNFFPKVVSNIFQRLLSNVGASVPALHKTLFLNMDEFFDPKYDYDFTHTEDRSLCMRGDVPYIPPYGWHRFGLKVLDKYPDGNMWLGKNRWRSDSSDGEWPVSYHGTSIEGAEGIVKEGYKSGGGQVYGRGVYSTLYIEVAIGYSKVFKSKTNEKTYRVLLQNRINPQMIDQQVIKPQDIIQQLNLQMVNPNMINPNMINPQMKQVWDSIYWLNRIPKGTSSEKEKDIVWNSIRPYGILLKEV